MTGEPRNVVAQNWQTTLADLLTLLLVFIISERRTELFNSHHSLANSGFAQHNSQTANGTNLAHYNRLERLTYLISCDEENKVRTAQILADLKFLKESGRLVRIGIELCGVPAKVCWREIKGQILDLSTSRQVFVKRSLTGGKKIKIEVDIT